MSNVKVPWDVRDLLSQRTFGAIAYFGLLGYFNCLGQTVAEFLSSKTTGRGELPDIMHSFLPYVPYPYVATVTLMILVVGVGSRLALHEGNFPTILRRTLLVHATTFAIRGVCVAMTVLPNPDITCYSGLQNVPFPIAAALVALGLKNTCGDVFFSGHAATQTLVLLTFLRFARDVSPRQASMATWYTVFSILMILATHFHYTLDVVFGCLIAAVVFHFYDYATSVAAADEDVVAGSFGAQVSRLGKFWRRLEGPVAGDRDAESYDREHGEGHTAAAYSATY
jgi:hypothetical protein